MNRKTTKTPEQRKVEREGAAGQVEGQGRRPGQFGQVDRLPAIRRGVQEVVDWQCGADCP
jgi:hypothetical protein